MNCSSNKLTNTSISPLMVNWANMIGEQIINVEPVVAEIRMYIFSCR